MSGGYQKKDIFARFKSIREKQNLASAFGIQKENWGNHAFFRDNQALIWIKSAIFCLVFLLLFRIIVA